MENEQNKQEFETRLIELAEMQQKISKNNLQLQIANIIMGILIFIFLIVIVVLK